MPTIAKEIDLSKINAAEFWGKVQRSDDGCWLWTGATHPKGYGGFKGHPAHRIAYALSYYLPPLDMMVCHSCDNPTCVRPDHLGLGTALENSTDASNKGRFPQKPPRERVAVDMETELAVMKLMMEGKGDKEISETLCISEGKVRRVRWLAPQAIGGFGRVNGSHELGKPNWSTPRASSRRYGVVGTYGK